ncbi:MAG: LysR family transcriptional regulator [Allorhizobium sp.]
MKDENWDDLRMFLHVASHGGLVGAANETGISAPTIGRRMLALERATGHSLFVRDTKGYSLTPDGEVLLTHVRAMDAQANGIRRWNENGYCLPIVSVACDSWLALYLARNLAAIWSPADPFRLCVKATETGVDMIFREAEIALTRERPGAGNLAARQSVRIRYAAYATPAVLSEADERWISVGREQASTPADRYISKQPNKWISLWTTTPPTLLELARSGGGRAVLPCFIGDSEPGFLHAGPPIEDLTYDLWITMHDDDRTRSEVRIVIDRLAKLFKENSALFAGEGNA